MTWILAFYIMGQSVTASGSIQAQSPAECVSMGVVRLMEYRVAHGDPMLVSIVCHPEVESHD